MLAACRSRGGKHGNGRPEAAAALAGASLSEPFSRQWRGASASLLAAGLVLVAAMATIALWPLRTGEPAFVAAMGAGALAYAAAIWMVHHRAAPAPQVVWACVGLGLLARAVLLAAPEDVARDAIRYVWDARVQRAGLNPYEVRPDDPALAFLHTDLTRGMDAAWLPTIYPPAAQVYFRLVASIHESLAAFRVAAMLCDALTTLVLLGGLAASRRPPGLALVVAWHPVLVFESGAGAHVDFAGALALAASQWALVSSRTTWAALLFATAGLVKPLPIVLLPLVAPHLHRRDLAAAAGWAGLLTLAVTGGRAPIGSMVRFIDDFRFNGPLFAALGACLPPRIVAALAVGAGLGAAALCRRATSGPAAWAWPQAAALALAPVIYPWYLAWVVPFVTSAATLPLGVWSVSILAIYPVWHAAARGGPFEVPASLLGIEFGAPVAAALLVALARRRRVRPRCPSAPSCAIIPRSRTGETRRGGNSGPRA